MARSFLQRCLIFFLLASFTNTDAVAGEISIHVNGLRNQKGLLAISLFSIEQKRAFPGDASQAKQSLIQDLNQSKYNIFKFVDVAPGNYALALLHDENSDRRLSSFLSIPREGFGFSNNPKIMFGPPSFEKVMFEHLKQTLIEVKMKYFL